MKTRSNDIIEDRQFIFFEYSETLETFVVPSNSEVSLLSDGIGPIKVDVSNTKNSKIFIIFNLESGGDFVAIIAGSKYLEPMLINTSSSIYQGDYIIIASENALTLLIDVGDTAVSILAYETPVGN